MPFENKSQRNAEGNRRNNQGMAGFQAPRLSEEIRKIALMGRNSQDYNQFQMGNEQMPAKNERTIDLTEEEGINLLRELSKSLDEQPVQNEYKELVAPREVVTLLEGFGGAVRGEQAARLLAGVKHIVREQRAEVLRGYNAIDNEVKKVWDEYIDLNFSGQPNERYHRDIRMFIEYLDGKTSQPTSRDILGYLRSRMSKGIIPTSSYIEQVLNAVQKFFRFTESHGIYEDIGKSLSYKDVGDLYEEMTGRRWR